MFKVIKPQCVLTDKTMTHVQSDKNHNAYSQTKPWLMFKVIKPQRVLTDKSMTSTQSDKTMTRTQTAVFHRLAIVKFYIAFWIVPSILCWNLCQWDLSPICERFQSNLSQVKLISMKKRSHPIYLAKSTADPDPLLSGSHTFHVYKLNLDEKPIYTALCVDKSAM